MALINYITQVQFGPGTRQLVQQELDRLGISRPFLITDRGVRAAGLVDRVLEHISNPGAVGIFDETPPNPNETAVRLAVAQYQAGGFDGIVAVGGGSAIDLAKGVAVCSTHPGSLKDFALIEGGAARITSATAPVIAIPTTAGTGSEVGRGALLILDDGRKLGIISPHIVPKSAICDPDLTMGLPSAMTAATGMDAIAHCMETFLSPAFNPPADGIALDGLWRAWRFVERATVAPGDREARLNMMSASLQGALAFQKGLGCVHSLSHSLGAIDPTLHHGTLNAIFLPAVIRFNAAEASVRADGKLERMAMAMRLPPGSDVAEALVAMRARLNLPSGLAQLNVVPSMFGAIIDGALADHSHKTNPRAASADDYAALLAESM